MEIQARRKRSTEEDGRNGLIEHTEFECHDCGDMITADIDLAVSGNHVIICPCGHEHCRVVKNGRITSARWDQRNGDSIYITATASSTTGAIGTSYTAGTWTGGSATASTTMYITGATTS